MCSPLCINKNFLAKSSFFLLFNTLFFLSLSASSEALLSLSFFLDSDSLSQCFYIFYSEFYSYCFHNFSSIFYFWVKKRLQLLPQPLSSKFFFIPYLPNFLFHSFSYSPSNVFSIFFSSPVCVLFISFILLLFS